MRIILTLVGWLSLLLAGLLLTSMVIGFSSTKNDNTMFFIVLTLGGVALLGLSSIIRRLDRK